MVASWQKTSLRIILVLFCAKSVETAQTTEYFPQMQFYQDFLEKIYTEEKFESCLIYGEVRKSGTLALMLRIILEDFKTPIIFQDANSSYQIAKMFNRNLFVIARLESFEAELPVLADILDLMRQKRIILIGAELDSASTIEKYLIQLFRLCEEEKFVNVVVIFADFPQSKIFHSYTIFPAFQLEEKAFSSGGVEVFPRRLKNLLGYGIRTIPDQIFPFTFAYELDGRIKVGGYLLKLLEAYAKSINGTLAYPKQVVLDKLYFPSALLNMTRTDEMDIPMGRMYLQVASTFSTASNPFSISRVCIMTPIKWFNSFQDFYGLYTAQTYFVLISIGFLTICTLKYLCRRLQYLCAGKRFYKSLISVIIETNYLSLCVDSNHQVYLKRLLTLCILVFLSMIWVLCIQTHFTANLNTFLTKPTMVPIPIDWDHLDRMGYKVFISDRGYNYISKWCGEFCEHLESLFVFVETQEQFQRELNKLNTNYTYLVDLFSWHFIQLRMRPLRKPIFRLTDMCVRREIIYCLPLQPNSVFKESLNLFLTRISDHGLGLFWVDAAYFEAVSSGKMQNITYTDEVLGPLDMDYVSFAWPMFGVAWTLAIFIFACEVVCGPRQEIRK